MRNFYVVLLLAIFHFSNAQVKIGTTNYGNFTDAVNAINNGTHTGAIVVEITGNTSDYWPTIKASGTGAANYTSITVSPSGGAARIMSFSGRLTLEGANNVTFDGLNTSGNSLAITNSAANGIAVEIKNSASNNTIKRCTLLGGGYSGVVRIHNDSFDGNIVTGNSILNCNIGPASTSTNLPVYGIYMGSTSFGSIRNTLIEGNNIYDYTDTASQSAGIQIDNLVASFTIKNNRFYQTAARSVSAQYGIHILTTSANDSATKFITGNQIGAANSQGTGMYTLTGGRFIGIYYSHSDDVNTCQITGNSISNIAVSSDYIGEDINAPVIGISVGKGKALIQGNTIGSMSATGSITLASAATAATALVGIVNSNDTNSEISDNNIGGFTLTASTTAKMGIAGIVGSSGFTRHTYSGNTVGGTVANSIQNNATATGSYTAGIYIDKAAGAVTGNTVRNLTGYGAGMIASASPVGVVGIHIFDLNGGEDLTDNTVYNLTNGNTVSESYVGGIFIYEGALRSLKRNFVHSLFSQSASATAIIDGICNYGWGGIFYNNMVALGTGVSKGVNIYGMRINCDYLVGARAVNNSIYIGGSTTSGSGKSVAFYHQQNDGSAIYEIHNNILVNNRSNSGTHSSIIITAGSGRPRFFGNIYYGNGNGYVLGFFGSTAMTTAAQWNSWSHPADDYGYFSDPKFIAPTAATPNLHISPTLPTMVEGHGMQPPLTDDFDKQLRSALSPDDIGADAGDFIAATAPVIVSMNIPSPFCVGGAGMIVSGTAMGDLTEFKIGSTVFPVNQVLTTDNINYTLVVYPTTAASGNITLTNPVGSVTSSQSITVNALPAITTQPQNKTICQIATTTFTVAATNAQTYQWRKNGIALTEGSVFSNVGTATLTVTNPSFTDAGTIDVVIAGASSGCSVTSSAATLTVNGQPVALSASGPTTLCAGGSVTLTPMTDTAALQFDGINDYCSFGTGYSFSNFTMSFWIKTTQTGTTGTQWSNGKGIFTSATFGASLVGSKLAFGIGTSTVFSNANINTGQWIHVAITREDTNGNTKIYLNGSLDASGIIAITPNYELALRVGSFTSNTGYFNGAIDNIRIWTRELNAADIALEKNSVYTNNNGLVHSFLINEGSGTSVLDAISGIGATLQNGPMWTTRIGPASFANYNWSNGQTTQTITVTQSGSYTLTTSSGGCGTRSDTVVVTIGNPQLQLAYSSSVYCTNGTPMQITATGAATYSWSPATGLSATTGAVVMATPTVNTQYTLTGTSASGCQSTVTFMVHVGTTTQLQVSSGRTTVFPGEPFPLTASGGSGDYTWSPATALNTTSGANVFATPTQTTTYTVSGIGCELPKSFTVNVLPAFSATDNALDFDGVDDYVSMPVQATGVSGSFTIAVWVKPTHATKTMHVFSTRNGALPNTFDIQIANGNKIHGDIGNGTNWLTNTADATYAYQANQWMHIAYVVKPGQYKIFVNGNLIQTGTFTGTPVLYNNTTNFITLGKNGTESTLFQGAMDDLRISNMELSDAMMQNAPSLGIPAFAIYTFDEGIAGGSNPGITTLTHVTSESTLHGALNNFTLSGATSNWVDGQAVQPQTITFTTNQAYTWPATVTLSGTTSSGLPITYSSSNTAVTTVSGTTMTLVGNGTATITASQAGNVLYSAATSVSQTFSVLPTASAGDNALDFDGSNDYVAVPVQAAAVNTNFTVEAWVKPTHATKNMHIISTRDGAEFGFDIQLKNGNLIHGDIGNGSSWLTTAADANFNYAVNTWLHIAYVVTPSGYSIYANGSLAGSGTFSGTPLLYSTPRYLSVGKNATDNTFFQGSMDDLRVYNTALTPAQVLADSRGNYQTSGLVTFYNFDEGTAGGTNTGVTILKDQNLTGSLHGTLNNFALSGNASNWVTGHADQQQSQAIIFSALADRVYGSGSFTLSAVASSGLTVSYVSTNPAVATVSGNTVSIVGAGSTTIVASQLGNALYNAATSNTQALIITKKALTITATANNKVYDGTTAATLTASVSGYVAPDVIAIGSNSGTFASANVGNGIAVTSNLTLTGSSLSNYSFSQPTGLTANITAPAVSIVNLKLLIEGYYAGAGSMVSVKNNEDGTSPMTAVEDLVVELHHPVTYALVATTTATLDTGGLLTAAFTPAASGSYYIAVKGRNIVQTWSAAPQLIGNTPLFYDFTSSASKAYGNNMAQLYDGPWAMLSGDLNHDDVVDPNDYVMWEVDFNAFSFGVFATDLNGDGVVDPNDYTIWEQNFNRFTFADYPVAE